MLQNAATVMHYYSKCPFRICSSLSSLGSASCHKTFQRWSQKTRHHLNEPEASALGVFTISKDSMLTSISQAKSPPFSFSYTFTFSCSFRFYLLLSWMLPEYCDGHALLKCQFGKCSPPSSKFLPSSLRIRKAHCSVFLLHAQDYHQWFTITIKLVDALMDLKVISSDEDLSS